MVLWIQKTFHTDKWWGKAIFMLLTYSIYWCVFYGSPFLIPESFFTENNIPGFITIIYALLVIPTLSFVLVRFYKKIFVINPAILYVIHSVFILMSLYLFFIFLIIGAINNF